MVDKGKWTRKTDNIIRLLLVFLFLVFTSGRMCRDRCCAGFHLSSTGECVLCPPGLFGIDCTGSCPLGYYGELCHFNCQCSIELCNPQFGCMPINNLSFSNTSGNVNYLSPITLTIALPTVLGLLCVFCFIITLIVIKMRKRDNHIPEVSLQTYVLDTTLPPAPDNSCYDGLHPIEDLPPPLYDKDCTDNTLGINVYDTC